MCRQTEGHGDWQGSSGLAEAIMRVTLAIFNMRTY